MDNAIKKSSDKGIKCVDDLAKRLHAFDQECSRHKQIRVDVRGKRIKIDSCPDLEARLDIRLEEMESTKTELIRELRAVEKEVVDRGAEILYSAADVSEKLKDIKLPSEDELRKLVYKDDTYRDSIAAAKDKTKQLDENKLDKSQLSILRNAIDDADQYIQEYLLMSTRKTKEELEEKCSSALVSVQRTNPASTVSVERLVTDTTNKIVEASPILNKQDNLKSLALPKRTKQALEDCLGSQLLDLLLNRPNSIYPHNNKPITLPPEETAKIRKHHHQRLKIKAAVPKITQMENETKEAITTFEKNLNSYPVQHLMSNLEHIDLVLKNHRQLLEFMNDPTETNKATEAAAVQRSYIPNTVNLNEVDQNISSALATAVVGYTKRFFFSDMLERVNRLEERM
ncbi:hypothetical protein HMPREF1544_05251 [Mucor circinelloides 1006PhL]|uniref:Uncharacterized protein n=1 Tax=Mucor circinelloides f. circinelloides (strain 1006PhL) TaxID=1220926 RepID=S2K6Z7_MUCC1|nr:hypothetical protein HMPREF1544_05251 [Mucor circinelloides 1006PhL]